MAGPRAVRYVLLTAAVLHMMGFSAVVPVTSTLVKSLGGDSVVQGLLASAFTLAQLVSAPLWGWASDRLGRRVIIAVGLGLAAIGHAGLYLARDLPTAFVARAVSGLGGGTLPVIQAAVLELSRPEERAASMAQFGAALGIGFVAGPLLGGALSILSPRDPFLAAAVLSATAALWSTAVYESAPTAAPQPKAEGRGAGVNPLYLVVFFLLNASYAQLEAFISFYGGDLGLRPMYVGIAMSLASAAAVTAQTVVKRLEKERPTDSDIAIGLAVMAAGLATAAVPTPYTYFTGVVVSAAGQVIATAFISKAVATSANRVGLAFGEMQAAGSLGRLAGPVDEGLLYKTLGPTPSFLEGAGLAAMGLLLIIGATRLNLTPTLPTLSQDKREKA
ncbi:MFS transporter [Pyrobaculum calidifontis]|uniref:Major facilitator superfamily MFS_1 n=1 Tax=Pyrobaculum calidifontis (strain DSM 21063 / JCM 11548 / VA1) TaxID=410359 RepID=A3MSL0_PYRCJ|nr:MFS transporter [Pyrobaculum calidifontis]ABO07627.1 major facilitator superfamily MFS_1 [Pyrobaculum calidifontis JCM 11548]